jgi:hypothetical protein
MRILIGIESYFTVSLVDLLVLLLFSECALCVLKGSVADNL